MADIFISYTRSDREWAYWIAKELEALGHAAHVHEWEIKGGDDIYSWMEARHDAADHVLSVVSDDYLKAPYSTLERNAALWQSAGKRPGFVLLVAVKPCRLPTLGDHIRRCELYGVPEEVARIRFREFMSERNAPSLIVFPGEVFAVSNIPFRVPQHFMGRDDSLAAIAAALACHDGRVAITALHGLRGVGKTTLAAAYAERHRRNYRAIWWIRAQTDFGMRADLVGLGVRLKWVTQDEKEEVALAAVIERLRHEGSGILLIYDNAIDAKTLRPYLPLGGAARVLVTSNAHAWRGVAEPVDIKVWPKEIGADFLIARTGRLTERAAAESLSEALGGLPLAHEQAAAYCERLDRSFSEYHSRFETAPITFLDDNRHASADYHDGLTVAKTFMLAIEEAAKLHPAAEPLITHASLLAPEPIPLFLFSEARESLGEPLASALKDDGLIEAIAALRAFALFDRELVADERESSITTDCIRLHRLVREVAAERCAGNRRQAVLHAIFQILQSLYPVDGYNRQNTWSRCGQLTPHVLSLYQLPDHLAGSNPLHVFKVFYDTGAFLFSRSEYSDAEALFRACLGINEKSVGSKSFLAMSIQYSGRFAESEALHREVLATVYERHGPQHELTVRALKFLAHALRQIGRKDEAEALYLQAISAAEKMGDIATVIDTKMDLGKLMYEVGEYTKAEVLCREEVELREKTLSGSDPSLAEGLNTLGNILVRCGKVEQAEPVLKRALTIWLKAYGPYHVQVGVARMSLANVLLETGRPSDALQNAQGAFEVLSKRLDKDHPWIRTAANLVARASRGNVEGAPMLPSRDASLSDE
jgi:tetratricopeptide (TPR) repeat protein